MYNRKQNTVYKCTYVFMPPAADRILSTLKKLDTASAKYSISLLIA